MGEAKERRSRAMENLSREMEKYPRDLLQRFMSSDTRQSQNATFSEDTEEIELNLGLSLGGRFGVDKNPKKLIRSSSIVGTIPLVREHDITAAPPASYPSLIRTSSLPTETEEEWRKRKELQSLRRMEAKRRRNEKQRNLNSVSNVNTNLKMEKMELNLEEENLTDRQQFVAANKANMAVAPAFGLHSWAAAARQVVLGGGADVGVKGKSGFLQGFVQPSSQGSVESQGGSSSGMSELESKPVQGLGGYTSLMFGHTPAPNMSMLFM